MQLRQENLQGQIQAQKLAPHLIQANSLLQCSTLELQQAIEQEQQENPALELLSDGPDPAEGGCRLCPGSRVGSCAHCPFSRDAHPLAESDHEARRHDEDAGPSLADSLAALAARGEETAEDERRAARAETEFGPGGDDGEFDPLLLARAQTSLAEQLLMHLRATSETPEDGLVAEYLVDGLNERGWLQVDVDEACAVLRLPCGLIMRGIERLQACDPPGVGARDLRECLLLQMRHMREEGGEKSSEKSSGKSFDPVALSLLSHHWLPFVQRRFVQIARKMDLTPQRIEAAAEFIAKNLKPNPAAGFRMPWDHHQNGQSRGIRPDVLVKRGGVGFTVEVLGFDNTTLQVNPYYRGLYEAIRESRHGGAPARDGGLRLSDDHQRHVIAYVERANMFLKNLQQRRRTIQKITAALIECQQGFLETGQRTFLRPLTRTRLSKMVGMHESTVSRALLYKYVQLPSQEVVSFDVFFGSAGTLKGVIADLVAEETPGLPLSDQAIVDALRERGFTVARRTVVKYREEMRICASYLRRRQ